MNLPAAIRELDRRTQSFANQVSTLSADLSLSDPEVREGLGTYVDQLQRLAYEARSAMAAILERVEL